MPSADEAALSCWEAGHESLALGDIGAALHSFREAVRIDPAFGEAHGDVGAILGNQGYWQESAAAHRRALELLPGQLEANYNLATALFMLEDFTGSEAHFRHVVALTPNNPDPWYRLGVALPQQSKCADALEAFERTIALDPGHVEAHAMAARELAHFDRNAEAKNLLGRVHEWRPELFDEWRELNDLWQKLQGA
jgi:protein O-GlcNAc transferase